MVKTLIMKGVDLEKGNIYGQTALMEGINNMSFESIKVLLENGSNINYQDQFGISPL